MLMLIFLNDKVAQDYGEYDFFKKNWSWLVDLFSTRWLFKAIELALMKFKKLWFKIFNLYKYNLFIEGISSINLNSLDILEVYCFWYILGFSFCNASSSSTTLKVNKNSRLWWKITKHTGPCSFIYCINRSHNVFIWFDLLESNYDIIFLFYKFQHIKSTYDKFPIFSFYKIFSSLCNRWKLMILLNIWVLIRISKMIHWNLMLIQFLLL